MSGFVLQNTANSQISYSIGSVRDVDTNQIVNNDMFSMYTPTSGTITVIRNFEDRSASAYEVTTVPRVL
ncbi:hypothetical protein DPMN_025780 [Dreissena polymorpha]|uniref:Uncharacterized protein n=1 Tax=Dreissena polymorpha TaxID=45954 RepID=A0A9D4LPW6_DREPO|nr:hypothetical protein DPMN_025780 [Dreissena polymorpha]